DETAETAPPTAEVETKTTPMSDPARALVYSEQDLRDRLTSADLIAKERYLRLAAEYDNFRKRVNREKEQWSADAVERFATDLLAALDDLDRALAAKAHDATALLEGVRLTERKMRAFLAKHGVETVDPAGQPFDPKLHEAVMHVPVKDAAPGTV